MHFLHIAKHASQALGLPVRFLINQRHTVCELMADPEGLTIGLPDVGKLDMTLIDLDVHRRGMIFELSRVDVRHEPNFDLMLQGTRRARFAIQSGGDTGWVLRPAGRVESVAELPNPATEPDVS